jgi:hypothetical protein
MSSEGKANAVTSVYRSTGGSIARTAPASLAESSWGGEPLMASQRTIHLDLVGRRGSELRRPLGLRRYSTSGSGLGFARNLLRRKATCAIIDSVMVVERECFSAWTGLHILDLTILQPVVNDGLSGLRYDELTLRGTRCLSPLPNCCLRTVRPF